nr:MAG TPA: hypothetical protein [Caudoviricetes sp.]
MSILIEFNSVMSAYAVLLITQGQTIMFALLHIENRILS